MGNVEQIVLNSYRKVLEDSGRDTNVSLDVVIGRNTGLDSLGLVNLMVEIEEALDITLESVLIEIRQSIMLFELVPLVERALKESMS
ncbi:phosphopantetheine-binding protein [Paenibacillus cymbidii]|uniref:phosphopantetheine-binding protein n=1 Tax=Paenibacillus cymbidii TaxID=1639034 RepID=UPI0010816BAB|nr:phosphopantetheine-binding protein [Paenibacillus cymbidii]